MKNGTQWKLGGGATLGVVLLGALGWAGKTLYSGIDGRLAALERNHQNHVTWTEASALVAQHNGEMDDLKKRLDRIESKLDALLLQRRTTGRQP